MKPEEEENFLKKVRQNFVGERKGVFPDEERVKEDIEKNMEQLTEHFVFEEFRDFVAREGITPTE